MKQLQGVERKHLCEPTVSQGRMQKAQGTNIKNMKLMNIGQVESPFQCPDIHRDIFKLQRAME